MLTSQTPRKNWDLEKAQRLDNHKDGDCFSGVFSRLLFLRPERSLVCEVLRAGSLGGAYQSACHTTVFAPPVSYDNCLPPPPQYTVHALGVTKHKKEKSHLYLAKTQECNRYWESNG